MCYENYISGFITPNDPRLALSGKIDRTKNKIITDIIMEFNIPFLNISRHETQEKKISG
jgi:hypothetical protein